MISTYKQIILDAIDDAHLTIVDVHDIPTDDIIDYELREYRDINDHPQPRRPQPLNPTTSRTR